MADRNVTINNLLPGFFDTARLRAGFAAAAQRSGCTAEEVEAEWRDSVPAGRFGLPAELGHTCAFLCSAHAGYITGQNLLVDGGLFPGTSDRTAISLTSQSPSFLMPVPVRHRSRGWRCV